MKIRRRHKTRSSGQTRLRIVHTHLGDRTSSKHSIHTGERAGKTPPLDSPTELLAPPAAARALTELAGFATGVVFTIASTRFAIGAVHHESLQGDQCLAGLLALGSLLAFWRIWAAVRHDRGKTMHHAPLRLAYSRRVQRTGTDVR